MSFYQRILFFVLAVSCSGKALAQGEGIGQWRSHLPYNKVICAATDGNKLFAAGTTSFFTYDILKNEINTYSKVNGMSDVELQYVAYDAPSDITVLAYNNSNIDLFKDETFYNIPDLKLKTISGDKKIYHIFIKDAVAYLSTGIGVLSIDLIKKEIKETFVFTEGKQTYSVQGMSANSNYFFAITSKGLYRTNQNNPNIQTSASWQLLDTRHKFINTTTALNKTFVATADSVFVVQGDTVSFVYKLAKNLVQHLDPCTNGLSVSVFDTSKNFGGVFVLDASYKAVDSIASAQPMQSVQTSDNRIWVADIVWGLRCKDQSVIPNGPFDVDTYDILANNKSLAIAHGAYTDKWDILSNPNGVSVFENDQWKTYNQSNYSTFSNLKDAVRLARDPQDNTLYIASQTDGLFYLKSDKTGGNFREDVFEHHLIDPSTYRLSGVAFDQYNNLWVTQTDAAHELMARSAKDGQWYKFGLPTTRPRYYFANGAAGLIIDDYNQQWFFSPNGGGVLVYNDGGTMENVSDDTYTKLTSGKGSGNLPDNNVQCIVSDKKGTVWIGTVNGIGIVNCPDRVISGECEAEIRVVQYDEFPGQLFAGENVKTIAVDGANRKWVGTGNGVWLISEDASKIINRFTVDNSPLPSNVMQTIKVDPVTGDVYFGTDKGLVSYRSTATDGGTTNKDVMIFPNPVKSDYRGTIAIKGLVDGADVRITDISGQLVYRTKALGGQAVWNGNDYTGRRPQTGVFLVFASNSTGTEKFAGKMVFIK